MKYKDKMEYVYDASRLITTRIGYTICTVYIQTPEMNIELKNFGYCPSTKNFYYNDNIHLSKEIIDYFNNAPYTEENIRKMKEIGINNISDVQKVIDIYLEKKKEAKKEKQPVKK